MDPALPRPPRPFRLEAVLFDFDGTLTRPEALDFDAIKREIGCPPDEYVLEFIEALPAGERRELAASPRWSASSWRARPARPERRAPRRPCAGCAGTACKVGVITRNGRQAIDVALARFERLTAADFDVIVTRDDPVRFKPAPDGLLCAAEHMGVAPGRMLMVGDFVLDAHRRAPRGLRHGLPDQRRRCAGSRWRRFGAGLPGGPRARATSSSTHSTSSTAIVRLGLPLAQGKLPADLLAGYLDDLGVADPAVLVGAAARRGRRRPRHRRRRGPRRARRPDHADEPPTSGATPCTVNANDIATSGAEPRWLLDHRPAARRHARPPRRCTCSTTSRRRAASRASSRSAATPRSPPPSRSPWCRAPCSASLRRADLRDKRGAREGDRRPADEGARRRGHGACSRPSSASACSTLGMGEDELAPLPRLRRRASASCPRRASRRASPACAPCTTSPRAVWRRRSSS